jgi:hypothetical protein
MTTDPNPLGNACDREIRARQRQERQVDPVFRLA